MLNKVHHVTYVVASISDMAAYMEKSFGIKPISTDEFTEQGFKSILFRIGETLVDFFEPLREDTTMARQLKATGPGVMHVAWGVDGIDAAFKSLQDGRNARRRPCCKPVRVQDRQHRDQQLPRDSFSIGRGRASLN